MTSLDRRGFMLDLLAVAPAVPPSVWSLFRRLEPTQRAAGSVMVASGEDRFKIKRSIGVSSTTFKASAQDSQHSIFAMEQANTKHGGPPLHLHRGVDEFWYVLAGEYVIEVGSQQYRARTGDCVLGPRDVPHRWAFVGDTPGRLLITFTPAGKMEEYFARPRKPGEYVNDPALYRRFGMELLGPPLSLPS